MNDGPLIQYMYDQILEESDSRKNVISVDSKFQVSLSSEEVITKKMYIFWEYTSLMQCAYSI